jgi:hypothetical protein
MRALLRNMPWSLSWFVLTGAIFLLQLFPFTGIFLMLVAAPLWSIATINLGFLSLAIESLLGRIGMMWLVLPLAWFAGYAGAAHVSQQRVAELDAKLRAANASERLKFEAAKQALVFDGRSEDLSGAHSSIVQNYRIPVAYQVRTERKQRIHHASRVAADKVCDTVKGDRSYSAAGINISWFHEGESLRGRRLVKGLCMISSPEDPELPAVLVEAKREKHADLILPHTLTRTTIRDPGGAKAELVTGHAQSLPWLPMPYMGCALNSGAPSWDCFAGFWRNRVGLGGSGPYGGTSGVIAQALGLEKAFAAERRDEIAAVQIPSLDNIVGESTERSLKVLDEVIANPARRIIVHDVPGLARRADLLGDRLPHMVPAIGRALANGRATFETARVLQGILADLPAADFDAIGPAMLEMLNAQATLNDDTVEQTLATRLGRFGVAALPALERMVFSRPKRPFRAAIYGLCRVGAEAEPLAERVAALAPAGERRNKDLETDVYVTLMRMGRADIVEREKAASDRFASVRDKVIQRGITPASPPSVCTDARNWPRFRE